MLALYCSESLPRIASACSARTANPTSNISRTQSSNCDTASSPTYFFREHTKHDCLHCSHLLSIKFEWPGASASVQSKWLNQSNYSNCHVNSETVSHNFTSESLSTSCAYKASTESVKSRFILWKPGTTLKLLASIFHRVFSVNFWCILRVYEARSR